MTILCEGREVEAKCPVCDSEALYRYGKTKIGKQRFLCLICHRQFTFGNRRTEVKVRPTCPLCGEPMHLYKKESNALRYRCSRYPKCRTFTKEETPGGDNE
jgi:transposase-like protein